MRRGSRRAKSFLGVCPACNGNLYLESPLTPFWKCQKYHEIQEVWRCDTDTCEFHRGMCMNCYPLKSERPGLILKENWGIPNKYYGYIAIAMIVLLIGLAVYRYNYLKVDKNVNVDNLYKKLKKVYPSQRNETWFHFLSVLENKASSVKSITFLYDEDNTTSDCLINELVSQFSGNENIKIEEVTFSEIGFEGVDYGLVLEHYHAVVKKFKVFRADLTEVSGKFARIFHSLCDEVSSDVKPSLFIFTIKCSRRTENLKPLERATTVLKETWNDLPSYELFPLLSRVIKNVVEIIPETQSPCLTPPAVRIRDFRIYHDKPKYYVCTFIVTSHNGGESWQPCLTPVSGLKGLDIVVSEIFTLGVTSPYVSFNIFQVFEDGSKFFSFSNNNSPL